MSRYRVKTPRGEAGRGDAHQRHTRPACRLFHTIWGKVDTLAGASWRRTALVNLADHARARTPPRYNRPAVSPAPSQGPSDPPPPLPDQELFREVFGRFATGVAVITSTGSAGAGGMTANAMCSLSLEPMLVLVCFENSARTLPIVQEAARFAVNLLSADQEELAGVFASKLPESEKLQGVAHHLRDGMPVIDGTLAWAVCQLQELIAGGDHTIAIGQVLSMGLGAAHPGQPLLWFGGRYHAWSVGASRTGSSANAPRTGSPGGAPPSGSSGGLSGPDQ